MNAPLAYLFEACRIAKRDGISVEEALELVREEQEKPAPQVLGVEGIESGEAVHDSRG